MIFARMMSGMSPRMLLDRRSKAIVLAVFAAVVLIAFVALLGTVFRRVADRNRRAVESRLTHFDARSGRTRLALSVSLQTAFVANTAVGVGRGRPRGPRMPVVAEKSHRRGVPLAHRRAVGTSASGCSSRSTFAAAAARRHPVDRDFRAHRAGALAFAFSARRRARPLDLAYRQAAESLGAGLRCGADLGDGCHMSLCWGRVRFGRRTVDG